MYIIVFALLLCSLIFHEILSPICAFLGQYSILIFVLCGICVGFWCFFAGKKLRSVSNGIGSFLALSQLTAFALTVVYAVVDTVSTEEDPVMGVIMAAIVCAVFGAYGGFNLTMVRNALIEGRGNHVYPWVVGIVGWGVNIAFTLL